MHTCIYITLALLFFFLHIFHFSGQAGWPRPILSDTLTNFWTKTARKNQKCEMYISSYLPFLSMYGAYVLLFRSGCVNINILFMSTDESTYKITKLVSVWKVAWYGYIYVYIFFCQENKLMLQKSVSSLQSTPKKSFSIVVFLSKPELFPVLLSHSQWFSQTRNRQILLVIFLFG